MTMREQEILVWLTAPSALCSRAERIEALADYLGDGTVKATSVKDLIIAVGPNAIATALPSLPSAAA
jgi:hypothetical protein